MDRVLFTVSCLPEFKPTISLEYFDFVGRKYVFEARCGAKYAPTGSKFSSVGHAKAEEVNERYIIWWVY